MNMLEENISLENAYPNDAYLAVDVLNEIKRNYPDNKGFDFVIKTIEQNNIRMSKKHVFNGCIPIDFLKRTSAV